MALAVMARIGTSECSGWVDRVFFKLAERFRTAARFEHRVALCLQNAANEEPAVAVVLNVENASSVPHAAGPADDCTEVLKPTSYQAAYRKVEASASAPACASLVLDWSG